MRLQLLLGYLAVSNLAASDQLDEAWERILLLDISGSHKAFNEDTTGTREARIGQALTFLVKQPRTQANIDQAETILQSIYSAEVHDEYTVQALYYLARIHQMFRREPDYQAAMQLYTTLWQDFPHVLYGQMAVQKMFLLEIYTFEPGPEDRGALIRKYEATLPLIEDTDIRSGLHILLAQTYLRFGLSDVRALDHSTAAEELGILSRGIRGRNLTRIGLLAMEQNRPALAVEALQTFINEFPRDVKVPYLRKQIDSIQNQVAFNQ